MIQHAFKMIVSMLQVPGYGGSDISRLLYHIPGHVPRRSGEEVEKPGTGCKWKVLAVHVYCHHGVNHHMGGCSMEGSCSKNKIPGSAVCARALGFLYVIYKMSGTLQV